MSSRVVTFVAVISLCACLLSVAMWVRSYAGLVFEVTAVDGKLLIANFNLNDGQFEKMASIEGNRDLLVLQASQVGKVYRHALGFAYISGPRF